MLQQLTSFKNLNNNSRFKTLWMPLVWSIFNFGCNLKFSKSLWFSFPFWNTLSFWQVDWPKIIDHLAIVWWNIIVVTFNFFKLTMLANSHVSMNPLLDCKSYPKIWTNLANNQLLSHELSKCFKFIKLSMVVIVGDVEDERCLSNMGFMKES